MTRVRLIALGLAATLLTTSALLAQNANDRIAAPPPRPDNTPKWIWSDGKPADDQALLFRKAFDLPEDAEAVKGMTVHFWGSCDNVLSVNVNGHHIGFSTEWQMPMSHDITKLVKPGRNVIAIRGVNQGGSAGLIARVTINGPATKKNYVVTDESWRVFDVTTAAKDAQILKDGISASFDDSSWKSARVIGKLGIAPWGALPGADGKPITATPADTLTLLPGFKAELLYTVPKTTQGSWVAMTVDPKGRLITSDQNGSLYRVTVGQTANDTKVEKIDQPIGHAQGLLCAFDALYVVVNGAGVKGPDGKQNGSGLYRLTDTDGDDKYDKLETLTKFEGAGEHGPHAIRLSPDKQSLYLTAGNFTKPPKPLNPQSPHKNWAEDHLLVRNPDGGGHDPHIMAPGGWLAKTDKDAREWTLVCAGLRNTYDFDFNADGEIFNYDSDMEWDTGTPWYRPIRVNLLVSGGEYGWRNGTGKWPGVLPRFAGRGRQHRHGIARRCRVRLRQQVPREVSARVLHPGLELRHDLCRPHRAAGRGVHRHVRDVREGKGFPGHRHGRQPDRR
jgi:hypothetical protein